MAALLSTPPLVRSQLIFLPSQNLPKVSIFSNFSACKIPRLSPSKMSPLIRASSLSSDLIGPLAGAINSVRSNHSTWQSAVAANIGTAATKVKMAQKEAQGVAEKRKGRRGPASVIGSSAAGCVCALLSISGVGGKAFSQLWQLGFVASFCTKLSDTVSSEIGKAYGKTTYLVTTFNVVPRGTEGAMSLEGTLAGLLASIVLAAIGFITGQIHAIEAVICVLAAQLANLGESVIGASFQDKEGFRWLNNDAVNIINISMGSILALLLQQLVLRGWLRVM